MVTLLIILIIAIIIASLLFAILKKAVKVALFISLIIIIFLMIAGVLYPDTNIYQKGKNYILGKAENIMEKGKDKATSYVVVEINQTINKAKEKILQGIERN